jgi:uncharacterized protein YkwD
MKSLVKVSEAATLALAVWLAAAAAGAGQQTASTPAASPPSRPVASAGLGAPPQTGTALHVWHHFGENTRRAAPAPSASGTWHHFGPETSQPPAQRSFTWRTPGSSGHQEIERLMYEMVNRDRADPANMAETKGRAFPLQWNDRLAEVARAHSLDMLNQGYFAHQDPRGNNVAGRVEAAGIAWEALGENIAIAASVAGAQAAFMNEPRFEQNHRANILSTTFTEVGIGIVQGPDGRLYITQDFCTPPSQP